uniref:Uncharacterized protein n=1 Tax=Tetranychus urticae TaxID=32264 RepID=T1KM66_TETUR
MTDLVIDKMVEQYNKVLFNVQSCLTRFIHI